MCVATKSSYRLTAPGASALGVIPGLCKKHCTASRYSKISMLLNVRLARVSHVSEACPDPTHLDTCDCRFRDHFTHHSFRTTGFLHFGLEAAGAESAPRLHCNSSNTSNGQEICLDSTPAMITFHVYCSVVTIGRTKPEEITEAGDQDFHVVNKSIKKTTCVEPPRTLDCSDTVHGLWELYGSKIAHCSESSSRQTIALRKSGLMASARLLRFHWIAAMGYGEARVLPSRRFVDQQSWVARIIAFATRGDIRVACPGTILAFEGSDQPCGCSIRLQRRTALVFINCQ